MRPYLEKTHHKNWVGGVAQGVGPEFKPQYHTHTKKKVLKMSALTFFYPKNITWKNEFGGFTKNSDKEV
jgi:hypothetical protein